jgi:hypothetical protein
MRRNGGSGSQINIRIDGRITVLPSRPRTMRTRVSTIALSCLKIGGAGYLLSSPIGELSRTVGEATYGGSIATMLIAGTVWHAADRREMARLTAAAQRALARNAASNAEVH